MTALVMAVGDTGSAKVRFTVDAIHIDTHFQTTGEHAEWDSAKSKTTPIGGFKAYEAVLGATFEVLVAPDGTITENKAAVWPKAKPATTKGKARDEEAAAVTHPPTPALSWLQLIFTAVPSEGKDTERSLDLQEPQKYLLHPAGREATGNYQACMKSKIESVDRKRLVDANKLELNKAPSAEDVALGMTKATEKKGSSWFSTAFGCMAKAEVKSSIEGVRGRDQLVTTLEWSVDLKDRGFGKVPTGGTGGGNSPSDKPGPDQPTK
ncbi:MAG: hypothetical protein K8T20_06830 [Planctomycetes bacterium]|nr:hypothetical protein [Planctomycetota bacterium]